MKDKVVFICKTDLNTDGRILNELDILLENFPKLSIDFILLPDKNTTINLDKRVKLKIVNCFFRKNSLLRVLTVFEFTVRCLLIFWKIKPTVIHVHDSAVSLPVFFYKMFKSKVKIIFDDHEIPNENELFMNRIYQYFENSLIKKSFYLIEANEERLTYIKEKLNLPSDRNDTVFLNLPFSIESSKIEKIDDNILIILNNIQKEIDVNNTKFIIHQGPIKIERGEQYLAEMAKIIPENYKILLLGGNEIAYRSFLEKYNLSQSKFFFVGSVNYQYVECFWKKAVLSLIFYLPTYLNNKLCAPNRLYLSFFYRIPAIINQDNPVLNNFVNTYNCGFKVEDIFELKLTWDMIDEFYIPENDYNILVGQQKKNLTKIYDLLNI